MTTVTEITGWVERAKEEGQDYMLVVCDRFDHDDYPVGCSLAELDKTIKHYEQADMQQIMEIYNLNKDLAEQLKPGTRAWNTP